MQNLPTTVQRAIEALQRHHFTEAADCLRIELILYSRGRASAVRLRQTANSLLSILA